MSYVTASMPLSTLYRPSYRGMGAAAQNVQAAGSIAAGTATAVIGTIAASGGTILGVAASALVPFVGPVLAGVTLLVQQLVANSGCGQTCIETSSWANQAAAALQKNLDAYFALPSPRTQSQQAVAIANFQTIWAQLQQMCGQAGTGNAGVRCISDRQRGACTWKQAYQPAYPGQPALGACFDWFNGYLDPISQDPVVPDATLGSSLTSAAASLFSPLSANTPTANVLMFAAAAVAAWFLIGEAV